MSPFLDIGTAKLGSYRAAPLAGRVAVTVLPPSLEGRGWGWVGLLADGAVDKRPTHPRPLPSREGGSLRFARGCIDDGCAC